MKSFKIPVNDKEHEFVFDPADETYKWGTNLSGIGIYEEKGKCFGNVVQGSVWLMIDGKPDESIEKLAERCLNKYFKLENN